jgi:hypothetical protein
MDDIYVLYGQVQIHDFFLRGGLLRIKPAEMRHSSLDLRRIDREDVEVDVPFGTGWDRLGRADGTPPPVRT